MIQTWKIVKRKKRKAQLTEEEYLIARQAGTERPFTESTARPETAEHTGVNVVTRLFDSDTKFDAGCCRVLRRLTRTQ